MKVFLLAALLAALYVPARSQNTQNLPEETKKMINDNVEYCKNENSIDRVKVNQFRNGMWNFLYLDNDAKCFMKCYLEKGVVKDGKLDEEYLDKIAKIVGSENMEKAKEKCKDKMQVKTCEEAYQTFKCFHAYSATVL